MTIHCTTSFAGIDKEPDNDFFSLSLEELINTPILSATSKEIESFIERPGIVSYITQQDIKKMGANNILDLLRRLPNIDMPSLYHFRNNISSVRAQHSDSTDTRVLILLNGRPMRESYNGGVNSPIYDGFPLSAIKWIEVIRGPGSVLHGSGAFSGVINIVTKTASSSPTLDSTVSYGSFGTKTLDASGSTQLADLSITAGIKLSDMDGWDYQAYDSNNVFGETDYGQRIQAGTVNLDYRNFSLEYFQSENKTIVLGTLPEWPEAESSLKRKFLNGRYVHTINKDWKLDINFTYNSFDTFTGNENITGSDENLLELTLHGKLTEQLNLLAGGTAERISWYRDNAPKDDGTDHLNRSYAELVYRPAENIRLAAGVQHNQAANTDSNTSPRFAATFKIGDYWGAKLLYGEAFRAAVNRERHTNIPTSPTFPGYQGKDDLNPETIATYDAQIFYAKDDLFTAINYYRSKEDGTIELDFSPVLVGNPISYKNAGESKYHGVEFEFKWRLSDKLRLEGSYSYQSNLNSDNVQGSKLTPRHMVKTGLQYEPKKGLSMGVFDSYFDSFTKVTSTTINNPDSESYHHLSANIVFNLNTLLKYRSRFQSSITVFGDNLLESDPLYAPDLARAKLENDINTLPIRPGRAFYLRYQLEI
jgi:outer membrane receptor for ferrienterochelin and colicin